MAVRVCPGAWSLDLLWAHALVRWLRFRLAVRNRSAQAPRWEHPEHHRSRVSVIEALGQARLLL